MSQPWKAVRFSLDLESAALNQLEFLQEVNKYSTLRAGPVLLQAINRYEKFWLPLAARYPLEQLAAPLDIEWVWHCHLLSPINYQKDSHAIAGCIVDHKLYSPKERTSALAKSWKYWRKLYPSEPFEIGLNSDIVEPTLQDSPVSSYDLTLAVSRQRMFFYQVSLPHYKDPKYLKMCITRYQQFLLLKQMNPGTFIVPCYDIDLVWHSHQLHPLMYKKDTERLLGKTFNHDDTVTDRSVGSKLYTSDVATRDVWKRLYHEPLMMYGSMYRGIPPEGKLYTMSQRDLLIVCSKSSKVTLDSVSLTGLPQSVKKLKLKVFTAANDKERDVVAKLEDLHRDWQKPLQFTFNTMNTNCIKFQLYEKTGVASFSSTMILGTGNFMLLPVIERYGPYPTPLDATVDLGINQMVKFRGSLSPPTRGPCLLYLSIGHFDNCIMPEKVEQMWGPVPLPALKPGGKKKCEVAIHRLLNRNKQTVFTVRIIHSLSLITSAVHVFYQDKMTAVAHLIGSDQLPLQTQVENQESCITLDPRAGERAVLIKNSAGDWAVVKGCWTGYENGVEGVPGVVNDVGTVRGKKGKPGSPGYLMLSLYKASTGFSQEIVLTDYLKRNYTVEIGALFVDLKGGYLRVSHSSSEIAEHVALAFSISLLHVMCQPRPSDWKPGDPIEKTSTTLEFGAVQTVPSYDMAFITAAGFIVMTPSNQYIYKKHGINACAGCGGGGLGVLDGVGTGVDTIPSRNGFGGAVGGYRLGGDVGSDVFGGDVGGGGLAGDVAGDVGGDGLTFAVGGDVDSGGLGGDVGGEGLTGDLGGNVDGGLLGGDIGGDGLGSDVGDDVHGDGMGGDVGGYSLSGNADGDGLDGDGVGDGLDGDVGADGLDGDAEVSSWDTRL